MNERRLKNAARYIEHVPCILGGPDPVLHFLVRFAQNTARLGVLRFNSFETANEEDNAFLGNGRHLVDRCFGKARLRCHAITLCRR